MSAERCSICGVYGLSTRRCCGNNPEVRIEQLKNEIRSLKAEIEYLEDELRDLENELK